MVNIYKIKDGFVMNRIADKTVVVPVNGKLHDLSGMIVLTESGKLLWNLLVRGADEESMKQAILDEYDVDENTASNDVKEFIEKLTKLDVFEK